VVYQETYEPQNLRDMHTAGPKRNFDWRLERRSAPTPPGFRRSASATLRAGGLAFEAISAAAQRRLSCCGTAGSGADRISTVRLRRAPANSSRSRTSATANWRNSSCALASCFGRGHCALDARIGKLRDGWCASVTMMSGHHTEPGLHRRGQGKAASNRSRPDSAGHLRDRVHECAGRRKRFDAAFPCRRRCSRPVRCGCPPLIIVTLAAQPVAQLRRFARREHNAHVPET